jgi:hypothetical protein
MSADVFWIWVESGRGAAKMVTSGLLPKADISRNVRFRPIATYCTAESGGPWRLGPTTLWHLHARYGRQPCKGAIFTIRGNR